MPPLQSLQRVVLTYTGSVTHGQDTGQRCVCLDFEVDDSGMGTAYGPASRSHAPPGLYMLWLVSDKGIPSVAQWVRVQ